MTKATFGKLAGVLLALALTSGCAAVALMGVGAAAGLGTYKYIEGTMEQDYPRAMQETYNACLAACRRLNLRVTAQQYGALESRIEAVQMPDTTVKITLEAKPNNITTVKVRFGLLGNEPQSIKFHQEVMRELGIRG
ncbi:MAG: DUF3568 domain-containing protein [Syntrophobacterales bacterium]|nr:DUF3568 domain-containing protein [Syntrophobacterales bacterium]